MLTALGKFCRFKEEAMSKKQLGPSTKLFPMPVALVVVKTGPESVNILTIAWAGIVAGAPPTIGIAVGKSHNSTTFLQETGNFTINLPDVKHKIEADYCGVQRKRG
jgi:flavin reductase (DIM6/NTAB) family NADH-FMN oxidoreductase RutF